MKNSSCYCKKCTLPKGYPGTSFNEDNVCSLCSNETEELSTIMLKRTLMKRYLKFESHIGKPNTGYYDCMIMLSGGKDSIYILNRMLKDKKAKVLAFTIDLSFESEYAKNNIKKVIKKLNVDHINFTPNIESYYTLLRNAFVVKKTKLSELECRHRFVERLPCLACAQYIRIVSYQVAKRMGIPYVLFCADPVQMLAMEFEIEKLLKNLVEYTSKEVCEQVLGEKLEDIIGEPGEARPEIIFPFIAVDDYDPNKIISELKQEGLYESDPFFTHCTLWGILNYFSVKHYDTLFYAYDYADEVRRGILDRDSMLKNMEHFKMAILEIANKAEISEEEKQEIKTWVNGLLQDGHLDAVLQQIANCRTTAREIGFDLEDIG